MPKNVRPLPLEPKLPTDHEKRWIKFKNGFLHAIYPMPPFLFTLLTGFLIPLLIGRCWRSEEPTSFLIRYLSYIFATILVGKLYMYFFVLRYKNFMFEERKQKSLATKLWGVSYKLLQRFSPPNLNTCNHLLPRQPVPRLEDTVNGYLQSVKPLHSTKKFEEIKSQAEEFLRIHGPALQNYAHLVSWTNNNYVTDLWEKYVYMTSREPLLINFSVGFADGWKVQKRSLARRAANHVNLLTAAAIAFYKEDVDPPGEGFCFTDRHNKVFTHSRIPQKDIDSYIDHGLTSHIVVQFNGCFYRVEVFDPQTRKLYQPAQLQAILDEIMNRDDVPSDVEKNLAALTADRRDKWAENREVFFLKNKVNLKFLNDIETALFFLILDPEDFGDVANDKDVTSHYIKVMTNGKGNDRWTDKPLNYHVTGCGRIGGTFEHGVCDGVEYRTFCEYVLYLESKYVIDKTDQLSESQRKTLKYAERMEIEEIPGMKKETLRCYEEQVKRNADFDLASIMFQEFGKGEIKKCECSPDAFLQMAYQLAYYRLHSHFPLTYEASGSLFYNNGRTETIRTVSEESCEFINDVINGSPIHLRRKSLLKACREHVLRSKNALVGKGIDRHLFVLYAMSKYKNVKSEFLDTYIGQKWTLSTSQVPNLAQICDEDAHHDMCFMAGSFGAVDKDGYGITYRFMGNHSIALHVSSYHSSPQTDSKRMREAILDALREMTSYFSMDQRYQEEVERK